MFKFTLVLLLLMLPRYVMGQQIDPTRPFGAVIADSNNEEVSTIVLQSVIRSNNERKAIINGQVLKVGDRYSDYELIAINANGVVLDSPQGRMELSLFSGVIANSK